MARDTIYYIIDSYVGPKAGTERQLWMLVEHVSRLYDVRLFVLRHTPFTAAEPDFPCPIECLRIESLRTLRSIRRALEFRRRIITDRPKVIHTFFNDSAMLIPVLCKTSGTLIVTSRRDMGIWYTPLRLLLLRIANRFVDRIVCNSSAVAECTIRSEGVARGKVSVIYNGLDLSVPDRDPKLVEPAKGANAVFQMCLLANLRPVKRIEDLIRAVARISKELNKFEVLIVGAASDERYHFQLLELVDNLNLRDVVRFVGAVDDAQSLLRRCDVGLITSASEGLSNSILEYMATGLPVICTNVGGNPELVRHGENGLLYEAGNVDQLVKCILEVHGSSRLRVDMGRASRKASERFTETKMVESHLTLYFDDR